MILVTGGTGLVGSHLLLRLAENEVMIRAVYRKSEKIAAAKNIFQHYGKADLFQKIEWVNCDITEIPALEIAFVGITKVYHCAALVSFDPADEDKLRKNNIEGTANIVNFCLFHQVKKLCHVSSIAALGNPKDHEKIINEETEWNAEKPHNDYAISKFGAEMEIWRGQQEGLSVVIINPGIILGPGFSEGSGKIFSLIKKGLSYYTKGSTGFVDVKDVAEIMVLLMESPIESERFTIISENLTFQELANLVADALQVKRADVYAKPWMTSIAWKIDYLLSGLFGWKRKISRDDARSLHETNFFSNEKIKQTLGFNFKSIGESVAETIHLS